MAARPKDSEIKQVGRFGLVGILNTAVDFIIFNILRLALSAGVAGVISGTVAMINSYIFNQRYTFKTKQVAPQRIVAFFALTAFGLYVIRPAIIYVMTKQWLWPAQTAYHITQALGLPFNLKFETDNLALVAAIAVVLLYNYLTYKKWVFQK
jgi:putative flippase GtrA